MFYFNKILSLILLPPGIFIIFLLMLVIYMFVKRLYGRHFVAIITLILYLISSPLVTEMLLRPLEDKYNVSDKKAEVIVVLGGGAIQGRKSVNSNGTVGDYSASRLLTAAQLSFKYDIPIIVTGGQKFSDSGNESQISNDILQGLGISKDKIIVEDTSRNTIENAINSLDICQKLGVHSIYLVTSSWHMPRSVITFNKVYNNVNIKIIPFPCGYLLNDNKKINGFDLLPQMWALEANYLAIREYLGLLILKIR